MPSSSASRRRQVLVVEDEPAIRFAITQFLDRRGFDVLEAQGCKKALEFLEREQPDAVVTDYYLPDGDAVELLAHLGGRLPVVVLTGRASVELAVETMRQGAETFLTKPLDLSSLASQLEALLEPDGGEAGSRPAAARDGAAKERPRFDPFLGDSDAIRQVERRAHKAAAHDVPILIQGETGTGKGVLARWLHDNGPRRGETFVDINCAELSKELLESELFGHKAGAFTGARESKQGLFEAADGGTLFLDEIGDMDLAVQAKVLKVVEEGRFRRLGEVESRRVDVRLIAASHHSLVQLVEEDRFRRDLLYRINLLTIELPPLRERLEDLPPLIRVLLDDLGFTLGVRAELSSGALKRLRRHDWPGNLRELRNVLARSILLADSDEVDTGEIQLFEVTPEHGASPELAATTLKELEVRHIERVLQEVDWNVTRAAETLDIPRSTLYQKLKRYGLSKS